METLTIIDVTKIEPKLKHPTIFENFDSLTGGESLVIHNDHDPKPLYYQLLGERGNIFSWDYLENGPEMWKVKIMKLNEGEELTIGELVSKNYKKAEIFKKYGIDFCCGGKKQLSQVCKTKGLDIVQIESELKKADEKSISSSQNYDSWDIGFLVDYILNTHHNYIRSAIPAILQYTQKVAKVHGDRHPEAIEVAEIFVAVADELTGHMMKEENILFPYIKYLVNSKNDKTTLSLNTFGKVEAPIRRMELEHDMVGSMFHRINELTNNYAPPSDACTTFKVSYAKLREFEEDLHQHIHLENNILFPKAMQLETELLSI